MNTVRVRSADQTATLSLALTEKDEEGCFVIRFEDLATALAHGFVMLRPPQPPPIDELAEAGVAAGEQPLAADDAAVDVQAPQDAGQGSPRARMRRK